MKRIGALIIMFSVINAFGQKPDSQVKGITLNSNRGEGEESTIKDSTITVYYANEESHNRQPAYFVNGKLVHHTLLSQLNTHLVEDVKVLSENIIIDSVAYYGKVLIKTKTPYEFRGITLNKLKEKYIKPTNKATLFMIDGIIIKGDYDNYWIDENNVLSITVDSIINPKENIDLYLLKILTRSEENMRKSKEIRIR